MTHPQALQDRLQDALDEIDALPGLPDLVASRGAPSARSRPHRCRLSHLEPDRARARAADERSRDLRRERATARQPRFALNFPEYASATQTAETLGGCEWEIFGEAQLFAGAQERNTLHAQRASAWTAARSG